MKRIVGFLLALAVLAFFVITTTTSKRALRPVDASTGCTDATLAGNYAFNFSGFGTRVANQPKGNEVPIVGVGVFGFDGAGNHSASIALVQNGALSAGLTASGTYALNADCTGSVNWTAGPFAGVTFNIAVIGGGPEIFGIETDTTAGITATFDAKKQ
jgi:hypothetical protein